MDPTWDDDERAAWEPPPELTPSQWAQNKRRLTRRQTSRPGPWRNENAPALVGLMDLCVRKGIREIWIKKAAQVGASEGIRNVIGRIAEMEPDPLLLVLPNEKDGKKIFGKRIIPLFEDTACLAALATGRKADKKLGSIFLSNGFQLQLAWAGSPSSLASDPIRIVILDEVDKYIEFSGGEAPPVDLARVRTRTYPNSLIIGLSTPTTSRGPITVEHEACPIKLWYFVPCPHCHATQTLAFDRLKWEPFKSVSDVDKRASLIRTRKAAWYVCEKCQQRIEEADKRSMLLAGFWGTSDQSWRLYFDGHEEGIFPEGDRIGLHLPAYYDLNTPAWDIAAETVAAGTDPGKVMHLRNSTLAETFEQQISAPTLSIFERKSRPDPENDFTPAPQKIVPRWVSRLVMTVDTQKDHFYLIVRGWGHGYRSQRIHHGRVERFEDLAFIADQSYWPYEDNAYPPIRCNMVGIDSGGNEKGTDSSRTDQVYQWCLGDPLRRKPLKGESQPKPDRPPHRLSKVTYSPPGGKRSPYDVWLFWVNVEYYQDLLSSYAVGRLPIIDHKTGELTHEEDLWLLNDFDDGTYNSHLAAMHKVLVKKGSGTGGARVPRWIPKTQGARVDFRACEVYQLALAHGPAMCGALPSPEVFAAQLRAAQQAAREKPKGLTTPDGRPFLATQR